MSIVITTGTSHTLTVNQIIKPENKVIGDGISLTTRNRTAHNLTQ